MFWNEDKEKYEKRISSVAHSVADTDMGSPINLNHRRDRCAVRQRSGGLNPLSKFSNSYNRLGTNEFEGSSRQKGIDYAKTNQFFKLRPRISSSKVTGTFGSASLYGSPSPAAAMLKPRSTEKSFKKQLTEIARHGTTDLGPHTNIIGGRDTVFDLYGDKPLIGEDIIFEMPEENDFDEG